MIDTDFLIRILDYAYANGVITISPYNCMKYSVMMGIITDREELVKMIYGI